MRSTHGGSGGDGAIFGGPGDDLLVGGTGRDRMSGDLGDDTMQGDADGDVFVIGQDHGHDVILGLADGESWIELPSGINGTPITDFATLLPHITDTIHLGQGSALVDLGDGNGLVLVGIARAQLQPEDFVFL